MKNNELESLRRLDGSGRHGFKSITLPILFAAREGEEGLERAMTALCKQASAAIEQQTDAQKQHHQIGLDNQKHQAEMARDAQKHTQEMAHERESHAVQLETDKKMGEAAAKAVGPAEKAKTKNEGEAHDQKLDHNDQKMGMQKEKHKVELSNSKKMTDAKVTAAKKSATKKPKKDDE